MRMLRRVLRPFRMQAAADVACGQLGYDFGSLGSSTCDRYGGNNMCGAPGSAVAMADLSCKGGELDIRDCAYASPSTSCLAHGSDSIVFCGMASQAGDGEEDIRLIDAAGAPALDGIGRLEIYRKGTWGPVCRSGFTIGGASVACKAMGYVGAVASESNFNCRGDSGHDFCGDVSASFGGVACSGQEASLSECPHEVDDNVFCAPEESVVIHCSGEGNAQGRGRKNIAPKASAMA